MIIKILKKIFKNLQIKYRKYRKNFNRKRKRDQPDMNKLNHIAFIMDGNGRWGKKKKRKKFGHLKGLKQ